MSTALYAKMAKVMGLIDRVPKNGWNNFHSYHYATEADLVEHIRHLMSEHGIAFFPTVKAVSREGEITSAEMDFRFIDADTGEEVISTFWGYGQDKGEKGAYKAYTGAVKYCLMKTFLVPTGDDPEDDSGSGQSKGQQKPPAQQGPRPPAGAPRPPAPPVPPPKAPESQPTSTGTTPPTVEQLTTLFAERKKRGKPGWDPILDAVTAKGFTQEMVAGKSAVEVEMVLRAFVAVNLTFQEVANLLAKMNTLPLKPARGGVSE